MPCFFRSAQPRREKGSPEGSLVPGTPPLPVEAPSEDEDGEPATEDPEEQQAEEEKENRLLELVEQEMRDILESVIDKKTVGRTFRNGLYFCPCGLYFCPLRRSVIGKEGSRMTPRSLSTAGR